MRFSWSLPAAVAIAAGLALSLSAGAVPAYAADPEFAGTCAMGLAEGKQIKTDCTVTWTSPQGKLYCFGNEDAKAAFLKDPETNLHKAEENFAMADTKSVGDGMNKFSAGDATAFIENHIKEKADKNGGLFPVNDALLGRTLPLRFDKVEFVRTLHGYGFFPNVYFADKDDPTKRYQIDFWLRPQDGKLKIVDERVYKAPRKEGDKWVMITRQPKPWWWIPASEHPGESEVKRGWEIMSAINEHIAAERAKNGGAYILKDDKTGENLTLDFIGIHQPVRRLKNDGRFFACTDFRKDGTQDQYFDIDFWLDEKSGKITVGEVRVHKVPTESDGTYVQIPRYQFDPKTFDVVP
ncbi:MAG: hypothetical protein WC829_17585 [Hyphomicrobium sp.]|jgi:hypothetical protein